VACGSCDPPNAWPSDQCHRNRERTVLTGADRDALADAVLNLPAPTE